MMTYPTIATVRFGAYELQSYWDTVSESTQYRIVDYLYSEAMVFTRESNEYGECIVWSKECGRPTTINGVRDYNNAIDAMLTAYQNVSD